MATNLSADGRLVGTREVCTIFSITDRTLRTWVSVGKFPQPDTNIGGRHLWRAATVNAHIARAMAGEFAVEKHVVPPPPEAITAARRAKRAAAVARATEPESALT